MFTQNPQYRDARANHDSHDDKSDAPSDGGAPSLFLPYFAPRLVNGPFFHCFAPGQLGSVMWLLFPFDGRGLWGWRIVTVLRRWESVAALGALEAFSRGNSLRYSQSSTA
jgi:hypothetical protein